MAVLLNSHGLFTQTVRSCLRTHRGRCVSQSRLEGPFTGTLGDFRADLLVDAGGRHYLVQVKSLSEGRRDRLIPLLAQAILQAKTAAAKCQRPTVPVAIVASNRVPASVAEEARRFAVRHAPEVGAGVIDAEGLRVFTGLGLDRLDASPTRRVTVSLGSRPKLPQLFSDLNQWMLKILVGQTCSHHT